MSKNDMESIKGTVITKPTKINNKVLIKLCFDQRTLKNNVIKILRELIKEFGYDVVDLGVLYSLVNMKIQRVKDPEKIALRKKVIEFCMKNIKLKRLVLNSNRILKKYYSNLGRDTIKEVVNDFWNNIKNKKTLPKPKKPKLLEIRSCFISKDLIKRRHDYFNVRISKKYSFNFRIHKSNVKITNCRLVIIGNHIELHVSYEDTILIKKLRKDLKYSCGIDIGLDNLVSVFSNNPEIRSFIVSGKPLKSFNQWFNKKKSEYQSEIDKGNKKLKKKLISLSIKRRNKFRSEIHKISSKLVNLLYLTGHKEIIIGKNVTELKNGINLGKKNNQNFVSIPFARLIKCIDHKAKKLGMEVKLIDESYTSKSSCLSDDVRKVKKKEDIKYGKRIKRGLFKDLRLNKVFNADLNGAANILLKGAKHLELNVDKITFVKLCNPVKFRTIDDFVKVSPESLHINVGIRSSDATETYVSVG